MTVYTFGPYAAVDPSTSTAVRNAEGQVYAVSDTARATPLAIRDLFDIPQTVVKVGPLGITEEFRVDDNPEVVWKSGPYEVYLFSYRGVLEAAQQAPLAAQAAAESAAARANAAATAAAQSQAQVAAYIAANPGGGSGSGSGIASAGVMVFTPSTSTSRALPDGSAVPAGTQLVIIGGSTRPTWALAGDLHMASA